MERKYIITLVSPGDLNIIRNSGCEIIAQYPDSLIARCTTDQFERLQSQRIEIVEMPMAPVRVSGFTFAMSDAIDTEDNVPPIDNSRKNYYIIQLAGPMMEDWKKAMDELEVEIIGRTAGESFLVGLMPDQAGSLSDFPWVDGLTPYRPNLKISTKLRQRSSSILNRNALAAPMDAMQLSENQMVEVTVFPGESTDSIMEQLTDGGAQVLMQGKQSVRVIANQELIKKVAMDVSVLTIQPFAFPELHNDVARTIISVPNNGAFSSGNLEGNGQIVAVCDSGLDTGNAGTIHQDFAGRIAGIVSLGTNWPAGNAPFINGPLNTDDGAADTNSGHGTHVAGSVLGDGTAATGSGSTTVPRGVAPQAQLYFQAIEQQVNWKPAAQLAAEGLPIPADWPPRTFGLYGLPNDLNTLFNQAYTAGARIHTNSWGAPVDGVYNDSSRDVDEFMWNNRDMLIIYSAGNEGNDTNSDGQIDLDSIGSPGTAKNCLTVGASENDRPNGSTPTPGFDANWTAFQSPRFSTMGAAGHSSNDPEGMACFSSRGPTDDGRIKPDVVAPGSNILSTRSSTVGAGPLWGDVTPNTDPLNGLYCWSGGTSMSTPLVAGLAALVREHLVTQRAHFVDGVKPSGALIKAFIVNGTEAMAGQYTGEVPAGVNNVTGFGRVNAQNTITPNSLGSVAFDDEPNNAVRSGQMRTYSVRAANISEPLRVTLCWTDRHSPGAGGLQNTLYLQVVTPSGTVIDGDVTPFPTVSNNVQQVTIANPGTGNYTIRVRGVSVANHAPSVPTGANDRQDFALTMSNGFGLNVSQVLSPIVSGISQIITLTTSPVISMAPSIFSLVTPFTPVVSLLTPLSPIITLTTAFSPVVSRLSPISLLSPISRFSVISPISPVISIISPIKP
ncbi:MAG: S8 family serine peptidase [Bacteroidota bacterium]